MECCICFEKLDNFITLGCCKNNIHVDCFIKCINNNESCPFCRKQYKNPFNDYRTQTLVELIEDDTNVEVDTNVSPLFDFRLIYIFVVILLFTLLFSIIYISEFMF